MQSSPKWPIKTNICLMLVGVVVGESLYVHNGDKCECMLCRCRIFLPSSAHKTDKRFLVGLFRLLLRLASATEWFVRQSSLPCSVTKQSLSITMTLVDDREVVLHRADRSDNVWHRFGVQRIPQGIFCNFERRSLLPQSIVGGMCGNKAVIDILTHLYQCDDARLCLIRTRMCCWLKSVAREREREYSLNWCSLKIGAQVCRIVQE